jgi:hypothetical protein
MKFLLLGVLVVVATTFCILFLAFKDFMNPPDDD